MKKNDLVKLAIVGLSAGLCVSGQTAREDNREMVASQRSESGSDAQKVEGEYPQSEKQSSGAKRKSAAQRVIEGDDQAHITLNVKRKSAAQRVIDGDDE